MCVVFGMNALSILVLVGIFACTPQETGAQGGGGYETAAEPEPPPGDDLGPPHDHMGSMCDLYGGNMFSAEMEDGTVQVFEVPVLCDSRYHYEGYPADQPGPDLPQDLVRVMRTDIAE